MNPRYPVYIPSKGRSESRWTMRNLDKIGVPYRVVVEPQEVEDYSRYFHRSNLLVTPHRNQGLVATRNWIWDHAQRSGADWFWTMDDNIDGGFYRLNKNLKVPVGDGTMLYVMEDFVSRYENVAIAGMNYFSFAPRKSKQPPFSLNRRVYSNMLIRTAIPYRNEGFYNDDTDLCLRVMKDGWCTVLFNAFLVDKATTMHVTGGMTPHYEGDGRYKMAKELAAKHPDVTTITWKFGRWQHQVDYSGFKRNQLKLKPGIQVPEGINNYGMVLEDKEEEIDKWQPQPEFIGSANS